MATTKAAAAHPVLNSGLFPVPVIYCRPNNLGTADCGQICRGVDGCDYAIKDSKAGQFVPHSEWFCSELGERVGIPAPTHKIMDMGDGTTAFGSRWTGGVVRPPAPGGAGYWYDLVKAGTIKLDDLRVVLSRTYAFDQFIANPDRHRDNFIVHDQNEGHALLAYDYSRAWLCNGFPPAPGPLPSCKTVGNQRWLVNYWGESYVDPDIVAETTAALSKISKATIRRIIEDSPSNWLVGNKKSVIVSWWQSKEMVARLSAIEKGVRDGTYL